MRPEQRATLRRIDKQFAATRAMPSPIPSQERYRQSLEEVRAGGYIRVDGQISQVIEISQYREKRERWYELELFSLHSGETLFLEWEKDDKVEVSVSRSAVSLRELGVTADDIEEMSEKEDGTIHYDGRSFHYDDDYGATYHRGGEKRGERVYLYDFETADERWCLTVEEWGSESEGYTYEAFVSEYLDPDTIEVLVSGTAHGG